MKKKYEAFSVDVNIITLRCENCVIEYGIISKITNLSLVTSYDFYSDIHNNIYCGKQYFRGVLVFQPQFGKTLFYQKRCAEDICPVPEHSGDCLMALRQVLAAAFCRRDES